MRIWGMPENIHLFIITLYFLSINALIPDSKLIILNLLIEEKC